MAAGPALHFEWGVFVQAGDLYRLMDAAAKGRLVSNMAGSLGQVVRADIVERAIGYFRQADADYGERVQNAVRAVQARIRGEVVTLQTGKPAQATT